VRVTAVQLAPLRGLDRPAWSVRVVDERGDVGHGEASPLPGYSPDDAGACARALHGIERVLAEADTVEAIVAPAAALLARAPAARFALETALFDLRARRAGCSLARCLGAERGAPIAMNGVIGARGGNVARWRVDAEAWLERGARGLKVKLGRSRDGFDRELAALHELRASLPAGVPLRLDANGAWTANEARGRLAALAAIRPEFVEEPTRGDALVALGGCAVPWAADESLADATRARVLLSATGCAAFVIKPAIVGGLVAARRLAIAAHARGLGVALTHSFDGPIARAAAIELALSLPFPLLACGFSGAPAPYTRAPGFVAASGRAGISWVIEASSR
jgi:L-alanine-DL-glutamate epimerase-like enolase superfamily enzyme